jgi:hypothetical protein
MRIEIVEIDKQGRFDVWHDGELICDSTLTPLCSAARVLLSRGIDPGIMLEKTRRGSDRVDMRAPIGLAARTGCQRRRPRTPLRQVKAVPRKLSPNRARTGNGAVRGRRTGVNPVWVMQCPSASWARPGGLLRCRDQIDRSRL